MAHSLSPERGTRATVAVIGSGIAGLSCAWLLSRSTDVTVFERDDRVGGHSHTVDVDFRGSKIAVDTGFIVYNEPTYPNLTALFAELAVPTATTNMSFAVSLDRGAFEYAGSDIWGLIAQPVNLLRPRFWSMVLDLLRFYREAPRDLPTMGEMTLDAYLDDHAYGQAFRHDHLYPMAAAIWSTPVLEVGQHPAATFVRFCENHGLLKITGRPLWRTVRGGSREYVTRLTRDFSERILTSTAATLVQRDGTGVVVTDSTGSQRQFDHVVFACHADTALKLLEIPSVEERRILSPFRYGHNEAVLHTDVDLMPRRRAAWASWNYLADRTSDVCGSRRLSVTYWMNALQPLGEAPDLFVTLNPLREPRAETIISREIYAHPLFDVETLRAQREVWTLQGHQNTWFCGAYMGAGFHEDGLQAGLAVAEDLGGIRRPWQVANDSGRIVRLPLAGPQTVSGRQLAQAEGVL